MADVSRDLERWLPVPGYEGSYEVSDLGRVRGLDREIDNGHGGARRWSGRVLKPGMDKNGRLGVTFCVQSVKRRRLVHQVVLETFVGPRPDGLHGCHNNGVSSDNRVGNLRWDTPTENMLDKTRHGTNYLANRKVCPRRHQLRVPNLVASRLRKGHRICLACARARANEQHAKVYGHPFDFEAVANAHYAAIMRAVA